MSKVLCFFCVKQKTAYEVRISDWSSDVCSTDLFVPAEPREIDRLGILGRVGRRRRALGVAVELPCERPGGDGRGQNDQMRHSRQHAKQREDHRHRRPRPCRAELAADLAGEIMARSDAGDDRGGGDRSEGHTSELQSLMRIWYAGFCLKKNKIN